MKNPVEVLKRSLIISISRYLLKTYLNLVDELKRFNRVPENFKRNLGQVSKYQIGRTYETETN